MPDYYQTHSREYFERTVSIDPSPFLSPFAWMLNPGARVLDVGCGSGRDLLWLKHQGFSPTGFERSAGLAALARRHSGCEVILGDFETFDFTAFSFDAILSSGALVHTPPPRLAGVLTNITQSLEPSGIFYLSLKQGHNTHVDALGRTFYYWREGDLLDIFKEMKMKVLFFDTSPSALNSKDQWLSYVLGRI